MIKLSINLLFISLFCFAGVSSADAHGVMHLSNQQKLDHFRRHDGLPQVENTERILAAGSIDLLSLMPYIGPERNQDDCGNCWVWAATGIMEIALNVQTSTKERLSIQYLNSNYNKGGTVKTRYSKNSATFACDGGFAADFAKFYLGSEGRKRAIPWANLNASFADGNGGRKGGYKKSKRTNRKASTIAASPFYKIKKISIKAIPTTKVGTAQAIANIKNALDNRIPVEFLYALPNKAAWNDFRNFWDHSDESALFNFDKYANIRYNEKKGGGAHAVIVVGYDDTDPNVRKHYWKVLNSWGTSALRPNGVFRVPMKMNYKNNDGTKRGQNLSFEEILPVFGE